MMVSLAVWVIAFSVLTSSGQGYVWQSGAQLKAYVNKYFSKVYHIPSRKETASMMTKYFLKRQVPVLSNKRDKDYRRAYPAVEYAQYYDTIFLIDSSSSVNRINFVRGLRALQRLVDRGLPDSYYAAITFANDAKLEFNFQNKKATKVLLSRIKHRRGQTNTQAALRMALDDLIRGNNSNIRYGSIRRILMITDGLSNVDKHLTLFQGFRLKANGVQIYVMAVGRYRHGFEEILGLASSTHAHLYRVGHMKGFLRLTQIIPRWPLDPNEFQAWRTSVQNRSTIATVRRIKTLNITYSSSNATFG